MLKAVVFDLDGTLLDRDASLRRFLENQYYRLIHHLSHIPKGQYISRFIELDCKGYVWKDNVYQQLVQEFKVQGISWQDLLEDYIEEFQHSCIPFPNLISMLENLENNSIKLAMITNGKGQFQMDNIRGLGMEHYFDCILVSEQEGMKKPDPAIFHKALELLGVLPHEAMYIGDHPENDVKGAKSVGMVGVWKMNEAWECEDADFTIKDLGEIPLIVSRT